MFINSGEMVCRKYSARAFHDPGTSAVAQTHIFTSLKGDCTPGFAEDGKSRPQHARGYCLPALRASLAVSMVPQGFMNLFNLRVTTKAIL